MRAMQTDRIPAEVKARSPFGPGFWEAGGWGLGMQVVTRPAPGGPVGCGWVGGTGTSGYWDPASGLVGIHLTQRVMDSPSRRRSSPISGPARGSGGGLPGGPSGEILRHQAPLCTPSGPATSPSSGRATHRGAVEKFQARARRCQRARPGVLAVGERQLPCSGSGGRRRRAVGTCHGAAGRRSRTQRQWSRLADWLPPPARGACLQALAGRRPTVVRGSAARVDGTLEPAAARCGAAPSRSTRPCAGRLRERLCRDGELRRSSRRPVSAATVERRTHVHMRGRAGQRWGGSRGSAAGAARRRCPKACARVRVFHRS